MHIIRDLDFSESVTISCFVSVSWNFSHWSQWACCPRWLEYSELYLLLSAPSRLLRNYHLNKQGYKPRSGIIETFIRIFSYWTRRLSPFWEPKFHNMITTAGHWTQRENRPYDPGVMLWESVRLKRYWKLKKLGNVIIMQYFWRGRPASCIQWPLCNDLFLRLSSQNMMWFYKFG